MKCFEDVGGVVNAGAIEHQVKWLGVESCTGLAKYVVDVIQKHLFVDSLHVQVPALIGAKNDRREHAVDRAAGDHVEAPSVLRGVVDDDVCRLTGRNESGARGFIHTQVSLVEE